MRKRRIPTWLMLMLAAVGLLLVIPGLWVFVSVTARPLHPNPKNVPTVAVLAHLTEENLPGHLEQVFPYENPAALVAVTKTAYH